jgi:hypothetical protein
MVRKTSRLRDSTERLEKSATRRKAIETEAQIIRRIGASPEERLRWTIQEFAGRDLQRLRSEELVALGRDLADLFNVGSDRKHGNTPVGETVLRRIQTTVRENVRNLLSDPRDGLALAADPKGGWVLPAGRDRLIRMSSKGSKLAVFQVVSAGDDETTILRGIADLIVRAGSHLRLCANPGCSKPFLAVKRQEYCSTVCSENVRYLRKRRHAGRKAKKAEPGDLLNLPGSGERLISFDDD